MLLQEEREIVREYGIIMLEKNLTSGTSGNISVFNREKGLYAMTPTSMDYRKIKEEDIVIIDLDGNIVDGRRKPSIEHIMHRYYYKYRDDINAVVHTHSPYATAYSCLAKPLPAVHFLIKKCGALELPCAPFAPAGSKKLAEVTYEAMNGLKAVLMQNHGLIAGGKDMEDAMSIAESLEVVTQMYFLAKSIGEPVILTEEMLKR